MRTKALLLFLICIVGSSIIFVAYYNQKASLQNLVTETHKQIKNFQENLKDVEEKRLVTDMKYLALVGLDENFNSTPSHQYLQGVTTVVTLLRPGYEQHIHGFLRNISHYLPNNNVIVYSVGLNANALQNIRSICNSSKCSVVQFELSNFPAHAEDDRLHVYRPLVIQTALNTVGNVLYMDSNVRLISSGISKYFLPKSGILTWSTKHAISSLTHPKMYEYFHVSAESFFFSPLVKASYLIVTNTKEIRENVMLPWTQCALTKDCICPIGAQSAGCRFNKRPQYRYSGCHAYDTSALNIVLGLYFKFDDKYVCQEKEAYFVKITAEQANEEYLQIAKQNNITEIGFKYFLSTEN